ncbi:MAG: hypothetical protein IKC69_02565 [Clostridia bacterium]|nr:hypothetical protein [Clostridia bacterium]
MEYSIFPKDGVDCAEAISLREETHYRESIQKAVRIILMKKARFVFLAGPSCSGKTTTSLSLVRELAEAGLRAMTFSTDDFFFNGDRAPKNEDGTPNYDAFSHTDSRYILSVLNRLCRGETALLPVFDFGTGNRSNQTVSLDPRDYDVFILEGIHALNDVILDGMPKDEPRACFYLDITRGVKMEGFEEPLLPTEVRFCRRLIRDFKHRFADAERTFSLWRNVVASEKEILHPFRKNADFTVETNFSYEIPVEKAEAVQLLDQVKENSAYYGSAQKMKEKLLPFPTLGEEVVPNHSVLREFID